jgi:hypothetical protein
MKRVRFYHEVEPKHPLKKRKSLGRVVAVFVDLQNPLTGDYDCLAGLLAQPDSVVCGDTVSMDYLRQYTVRISEAKARAIHPRLFARLDEE